MNLLQNQNVENGHAPLQLNFTLRTVGEWRELLRRTTQTPWTQTIQYGYAVSKVAYQSTRYATLERRSEIVGVVAIQELKWGPIHHITITRGPLWFSGHETPENLKEFSQILNNTFPRRPLRKLRWLPEWKMGDTDSLDFIEATGRKLTPQSFETLWLDLKPSLDELKKKLDRKWRGHLHKAERSPLEISIDMKGLHLDSFLRAYDSFKAQKKFDGPNGTFMKHEIEKALPFKDAIILWARLKGLPVAGVVVMKHGTSASYRISWNTPEGRLHNAHFLLLWKALEVLKSQGVESFDLGGILPDDNNGLNIFKLGMNGVRFKTRTLK